MHDIACCLGLFKKWAMMLPKDDGIHIHEKIDFAMILRCVIATFFALCNSILKSVISVEHCNGIRRCTPNHSSKNTSSYHHYKNLQTDIKRKTFRKTLAFGYPLENCDRKKTHNVDWLVIKGYCDSWCLWQLFSMLLYAKKHQCDARGGTFFVKVRVYCLPI